MTPRAVATGPAASSSKSAGERLVLQLFRRPFLSEEAAATLARKASQNGAAEISRADTEQCFNVETTEALSTDEMTTLQWLLRETFEPDLFASSSAFADVSARVVEVGPRLCPVRVVHQRRRRMSQLRPRESHAARTKPPLFVDHEGRWRTQRRG